MATIYIDNKPYTVQEGDNLLHACLSLGFNIPYFCWHPAMHSVGACRQCAVKQFKDEHDERGKIVMSCMTPVTNGTRISIDDPEVLAFRKSIIEFLMINHPHDCPVCDEGGECHLQDMTLMTGHNYRRFRFKKRTYRNQNLGPFVNHEMNRCIQCYRCVRFYKDYAGGRDLDVFASRDRVYFGRHEDGVLENEFSGNLVEICPTGVFTDKTLKRHYSRKWDLQTAPSVCVHCGLGCNTIPGERYGILRRIQNRYNDAVNRYFLCDRGRYGYEFVNSERRIREPMLKRSDLPVPKGEVMQHLSRLLYFGARVIGIGSPRASLEANFALRSLVGEEHFYTGLSELDERLLAKIIKILKDGPARSPSIREVGSADAVFVLGEDVTNSAPLLALALRQSVRRKPMEIARRMHIPEWDDAAVRGAVQQEKGPLFSATPYGTKLEEVSSYVYHAAPDDLARFGFAVAHELDNRSPAVNGLTKELHELAAGIAQALKEAQQPLIVSGTGCGSGAVIEAAANIAWALCREGRSADLCFAVPECNSMGVALMGGGSLKDALKTVYDGAADTVIVLENDLYRRAEQEDVNRFLDRARHVIVIDHSMTETASKADVVVPSAAFAETDGTLVNNEGRAQRFYRVFVPHGNLQESWRWLRDMMYAAGRPGAKEWMTLEDIARTMEKDIPVFGGITKSAPPAEFRVVGQKIPRQPHRQSGRTAMHADISVIEPKPAEDTDSPFSFSMEGYEGQPPAELIPRFWSPGWNSVQAVNKFQSEVGGPLRGGDSGQRLLGPVKGGAQAYFNVVPDAFSVGKDALLFVRITHIFGSEELSAMSPSVSERSPAPYIGLRPEDAAPFDMNEGEDIRLTLNGVEYLLPVKHLHKLPAGVGVLPAGLDMLKGIELPAWGTIKVVNRET
ncbi:MAG: NADH-quinone oxidoreductase subunit NuoG [Dissulfurispiraceae bacterium]